MGKEIDDFSEKLGALNATIKGLDATIKDLKEENKASNDRIYRHVKNLEDQIHRMEKKQLANELGTNSATNAHVRIDAIEGDIKAVSDRVDPLEVFKKNVMWLCGLVSAGVATGIPYIIKFLFGD